MEDINSINHKLTTREEKVIEKKIDEFVECVKNLKKHQETLTVEVVELKATKAEIVNEIKKTVPSTPKIISEIKGELPDLFVKLFNNLDGVIATRMEHHLRGVSDSSMQSIVMLKNKTEELQRCLEKTLQSYKSILWYKGLIIYVSCLLSGVATAGFLYYFFPQTKTIHHQISMEDLGELVLGKSVNKISSKIDDESWKIITDAYEKEIKLTLGKKSK